MVIKVIDINGFTMAQSRKDVDVFDCLFSNLAVLVQCEGQDVWKNFLTLALLHQTQRD